MDCKGTSEDSQEIRIVCTNPEAGCDNLFLGGVENTIVRLPEEVCVPSQILLLDRSS